MSGVVGHARSERSRFFEVYNGHAMVNNHGDGLRAGTERMWDVILSLRLAAGETPIYGLANDDAHHYAASQETVARPGRGWVAVRAPRLAPHALIDALEAGDFYASTGVELRDVPAHPYSFSDNEFFFPAFGAAGLRLGLNPMAVHSEPRRGHLSGRYSIQIGLDHAISGTGSA